MRDAGRAVGEVLAECINFFNPGAIVHRRGPLRGAAAVARGVREAAIGRSLPMATRDLRVGSSQLGARAGVIGAAVMVIEHVLAPENVDRAGAPHTGACACARLSASAMPDFDPIAEARRNWSAHWGDEPVPSMSAVTSIMRVQQILLARLNDELKPFDLTFPRYEALMLLYYSAPRRAAAGQDGRPPAGAPHERDQHHRRARALGLRHARAARARPPHDAGGDHRRGAREVAEAADAESSTTLRFGTAPLEACRPRGDHGDPRAAARRCRRLYAGTAHRLVRSTQVSPAADVSTASVTCAARSPSSKPGMPSDGAELAIAS